MGPSRRYGSILSPLAPLFGPDVHARRYCTVSSDIGTGEDELLQSIEEVEDRIKIFRKKVRAVLASAQFDSGDELREEKA